MDYILLYKGCETGIIYEYPCGIDSIFGYHVRGAEKSTYDAFDKIKNAGCYDNLHHLIFRVHSENGHYESAELVGIRIDEETRAHLEQRKKEYDERVEEQNRLCKEADEHKKNHGIGAIVTKINHILNG